MSLDYKPPKNIDRVTLTLVLKNRDGVASFDYEYDVVVTDEDGTPIRTPNTRGKAGTILNTGDKNNAEQLLRRVGARAVTGFGTDPLP